MSLALSSAREWHCLNNLLKQNLMHMP